MVQLIDAVDEFVGAYFSTKRRSEKTKRAYSTDLGQFVDAMAPKTELSEVTFRDLEQWGRDLQKRRYATSSIRRKFAAVRVFYSFLLRRGTVSESPLWRVQLDLRPPKRLPRVLPIDDVSRLLTLAERAAEAPQNPWRRVLACRNRAIVELLFATGLRVGEVVGLDVADYRPATGDLRVLGKGARERRAIIPDRTSQSALSDYLAVRQGDSPALFLNNRGGRLSTQGAANAVKKIALGAGIERHVTPHVFRHTIATQLLERGADVRIVQTFLGHASITTTQRYTHVSQSHLERTLAACHPNIRTLCRAPVERR